MWSLNLRADDPNLLAVTGTTHIELDLTSRRGEQGVVLAYPNVITSVKFCAALAHDNTASRDLLTTKDLDAQSLAF
jgi:hypothetical protein